MPNPFKVWDGTAWRKAWGNAAFNAAYIAPSNTPTTTTITSIPSAVNGTAAFTIAGTISPAPPGGTVSLYRNGAYYGAVAAGSSWSASVSESGTSYWYAVYSGSGSYLASQSGSYWVTCRVLTTYTKTYGATSAFSYDGSGNKRTDNTNLYQGYYSSTWGLQRSIITFGTTAETDLTGANAITKVELYLNCLHWGPDSGGTAVVHTCSNTGAPGSWSGVSNLSGTTDNTAWTTKTGAKWCDLSSISGILTLSNWVGSPTMRAVALYINSTATEYYGYFAGAGATGEPQLRITYNKWV